MRFHAFGSERAYAVSPDHHWVERFDGTAWTDLALPAGADLGYFEATGPDTARVATSAGLAQWDGTAWTHLTGTDLPIPAAVDGDGRTWGYSTDPVTYRKLVSKLEGTTWTTVTLPENFSSYPLIRSVPGTSHVLLTGLLGNNPVSYTDAPA